MTDGTPASISTKVAALRSTRELANNTWLTMALVNFLGGYVTSFELPDTVPGTVNPLLWRTSPSWISPSLADLEPG